MIYDALPPLETMERVPLSDLSDKLDEIFARIERENIGFVLTKDGYDKYVLCPYGWFDDSENVKLQIDSELFAQVTEVASSLGGTPENLIQQFFEWCINPDTTDEAVAWLIANKDLSSS